MSSKPESLYYRGVHRLLPKGLHVEKMNNPYRGGTADVWYSGNGGDLWVEYKFIQKPPNKALIDVSKELSSLQMQWLRDRHLEGRSVCVILGTPLGGWIYEDLAWETKKIYTGQIVDGDYTKQYMADFIVRKTMNT